jgi:16S rRNA (uracil1498-N3)-methyltransferase
MPHNRYFIDVPLCLGNEVLLVGEEAHHLHRVMRKSEGDEVELINGLHQLGEATLVEIEKKGIRLRLTKVIEKKTFKPALIVCQAIPRFNRLENLVEKGTELGMTSLWLFPGQLGEKKNLSPTQWERLRSVAIAAIKQSGRLDLPSFVCRPALDQWTSLDLPAYFGDLASDAPPLLSELNKLLKNERQKPTAEKPSILFFIGPEAGLSESEGDKLRSLQAQGVRLHSNVLRTDTASLAALSIISNFFL